MQRKVNVSAKLADGTKVYTTATRHGGAYIDIALQSHPAFAMDTVNVYDYAKGAISAEYQDLLKGSASREQYEAIRKAVREHVSEYSLRDWVNLAESVGVRL